MNKPIILVSLIAAIAMQWAFAEPLSLDSTTLREDFDFAGIASYKCKTAVKDFEEAIIAANAQAETNRASIAAVAKKHLGKCMDEAQAAGDLGKVVALKTALETADGEMRGELADIVRLRAARDAQLVKIDKNLIAAGIAAARAFYVSLDLQKKESTKKGDIDEAKKIDAFQQKLSKWANEIKPLAASVAHETTQPPLRPQPRQSVQNVTSIEPVARIITIDAKSRDGTSLGKVNTGDTIEIQYVDGRWNRDGNNPVQSPDNEGTPDYRCCVLVRRGDQNVVVARLPAGTKTNPYLYMVEEDMSGEFALRIGDSWGGRSAGSVRYSVKVIPGEKSKTESSEQVAKPEARLQPRQPVSAVKRLEPVANVYTVHAKNMKCTLIGQVKAGDRIEIQYVDGKWAQHAHDARKSPDNDPGFWLGAALCKLDKEQSVLADIPAGTKDNPFVYHVDEEDAGKVALRLKRLYSRDDGFGTVRYSVKIIPKE